MPDAGRHERSLRSEMLAPFRRWAGRMVAGPVEAAAGRAVRAELDGLVGELLELKQELSEVERRSRRDIISAGERDAARSSARFAEQVMPTGRWFPEPHETLTYALDQAPRGGMALEFGVWAGRSLAVIAEARKGREVYGFDSFQGLPEDYRWDVAAGTFAVDELPVVEGAELVVGWFEDTLPGFLADHPGPVAFVHIDSDLYSSAVTVLELVGPRLMAGSVLLFDEYFNYAGWEKHEHRAFQEFLDRTGATAQYLAYTSVHEQVAVRILTPGGPRSR